MGCSNKVLVDSDAIGEGLWTVTGAVWLTLLICVRLGNPARRPGPGSFPAFGVSNYAVAVAAVAVAAGACVGVECEVVGVAIGHVVGYIGTGVQLLLSVLQSNYFWGRETWLENLFAQ